MKRALLCGLLVTSLPHLACAEETFAVRRDSVITFGHGDGDTFGLDEIQRDAALVLIRPQGESCTLRFPIVRGERLWLRAVGDHGQPLSCEALFVSAEGEEARFTAKCTEQHSITPGPKCPPSASAQAPAQIPAK